MVVPLLVGLACQTPAGSGRSAARSAADDGGPGTPSLGPEALFDAGSRDAGDAPATGDAGDAASTPPEAGEGPEPPETRVPELVVEIGPSFAGRTAGKALEAYATGEFAEAARLFDRVRADLADGDPRRYDATLMSGLAHLAAGNGEAASERLGAIAGDDHPLGPFVLLRLAEAQMAGSHPREALETLGRVSPSDAGREGAMAKAAALMALGRPADAAAVLDECLEPSGPCVASGPASAAARLRRAQAVLEAVRPGAAAGHARGQDLERCRAALADLRSLRVERAGAADADAAERLIRAHASLLPVPERAAMLDLTTAERLDRVRKLTSSYRYDEALEEADRLVEEVRPDDALGCAVLDAAGDAAYRARDYARAARRLDGAEGACAGAAAWAGVAFRAARAHLNSGDADGAAALYRRIEEESPRDLLADDARMARAEIAFSRGESAEGEALLESVPRDYPDGDQIGPATWALGWRHLLDGRAGDAERLFAGLERSGWASPERPQGGRVRYWHAVALAEAGQADRAQDEFRAIVREHALTFYGLLAYNRVRLADPGAAREALDAALVARPRRSQPSVRIPDLPIVRSAGFKRALAFLRLGLYDEAQDEIAAMRAGTGLPREAAAALAALAQRVGAFRLGRSLGQDRSPLGSTPLTPPNERTWEIAYPKGYPDHVEKAARDRSLPPGLILGVIREESGFDPFAFSSAHAVGLMQLLVPTAQRFAPSAGIDGTVSRRRLGRPSVNIAIGSAFLGFLAERYPDRLVLLPAAYNAGEGRLDRWLRERGDLPLDRFVESLPFDQTRTYLMRVVSSWAVYQALYYTSSSDDEPLPLLDPTAPARPTDPVAAP